MWLRLRHLTSHDSNSKSTSYINLGGNVDIQVRDRIRPDVRRTTAMGTYTPGPISNLHE